MAQQAQERPLNAVAEFLNTLVANPALDQDVVDALLRLASEGELKRPHISAALKTLRDKASEDESR